MRLRWIHKIETSSHCNFQCVYCPNPYGLGYGKGNMSMETFERVVYWASILNASGQPNWEPFVHLHGIGEPLLNPHIIEFVRMLSEVVPCGFSTNGALLTDARIEALEDAGIGYLCVSSHDRQVFQETMERLKSKTRRFEVFSQEIFDDDFAGQVKNSKKNALTSGFHCAHIESGGAQVLWNGDFSNCCVDAQGYPILGSVHDDEIRGIEIEMIPLCRNCRNNAFVLAESLGQFSPTLSQFEREAMLWEEVIEQTKRRHVEC